MPDMVHLMFLLIFPHSCYSSVFSVIVNEPSYKTDGVLAAFGDFNADRMVDIFVIDQSNDQVDVLFANSEKQFVRQTIINQSLSEGLVIGSVMLADFNADLNMDVLVVHKQDNERYIYIYWGNHDKKSVNSKPYAFNVSFKDDPILFDYNADMIPDLLAETADGNRLVWLSTIEKRFILAVNVSSKPLAVPHSCAFVDIFDNNGADAAADLVLTVQDDQDRYQYQIYSRGNVSSPDANLNYTFDYYDHLQDYQVYSSSFGDFNQDGIIDHVVLACSAAECGIHVRFKQAVDKTKWFQMLTVNKSELSFVPVLNEYNIPPMLRVGDYDMDGYLDAVVTMSSSRSKQMAYLLRNVPCDSSLVNCSGYGRMFEIKKDELSIIDPNMDVIVATFFDFNEDGTLDIAMTVRVENTTRLLFLKNNLADDTCFLKVIVIGGKCAASCKNSQPYGVNVPGPTVKYLTTTTKGLSQTCAGGQLTQSSHFALQLPYVLFGLGQTPNFVDTIGVGIPQNSSTLNPRSRDWQQIIPNSQLIVITFPIDEPFSWSMKLFVTPSKQIWLTGIALAATCGLVAIIVGALHLQERREDNKEKKQESQKFHFDAM